MSSFMRSMPSARLEVEAAGVERDALADDRHLLAALARRRVRQVDELRRLLAARRHAEEGAHARASCTRRGRAPERRARPPWRSRAATLARCVGCTSLAGALMRSRANHVASAKTSPRRAPSAASRALAPVGLDHAQRLHAACRSSRACSGRRCRCRGWRPRPPPGRAGAPGSRSPSTSMATRAGAEIARAAQPRRRRAAHRLGRRVRALAEPDHDDAAARAAGRWCGGG